MSKNMKIAFSPYLSVSPWQQWTCKQMFEYRLGNCGILPLLCQYKQHKIRNFKVSENLRPKKLLIDPGPFQNWLLPSQNFDIFLFEIKTLLYKFLDHFQYIDTWHFRTCTSEYWRTTSSGVLLFPYKYKGSSAQTYQLHHAIKVQTAMAQASQCTYTLSGHNLHRAVNVKL